MIVRRCLTALVFTCFGIAGVANAGDAVKIGIVDFEKVAEVSEAGKRSINELKSQLSKMQESLREKEEEVAELQKSLEQKALVMSEEARDEKEREMRIKLNDLKSLSKRYQERLGKLQIEHLGQIQKDCLQILEDIGERDGYLLILEKREGGVVYAPEAIDITDSVIKAYNAMDVKRGKKN